MGAIQTLREKQQMIPELTAAAKAAGDAAKKLLSDRQIMERKYSVMSEKAALLEIEELLKDKTIKKERRIELEGLLKEPEKYISSRKQEVFAFDPKIHEQEKKTKRFY